MRSQSTHRQPAGTPVGGQFAATTRTEPGLTLEAFADELGAEDPFYDPDDPYGAEAILEEMADRAKPKDDAGAPVVPRAA